MTITTPEIPFLPADMRKWLAAIYTTNPRGSLMAESNKGRVLELIIVGIVFPVIATVLATWITGSWPKISSFLGFQPIKPDQVLREDRVNLPVTGAAARHAADLDGGRIVPIGTSLSSSDADLVARQTPHGIVLEPGFPKDDTDTFEARFTGVSDAPVGRGGCAKSSIAPKVTNHLQLGPDIHQGSHVCMVTTQGRLAEFEISKVDLSSTKREVEIRTIVWKN
jgi:hypothetical protein